MKVLLIDDFLYSGGAETVFRATYEVLQKADGIEVEMFYGTETHTKPDGAISYLFSFSFRKRMREMLKAIKPDIIHIHGFYHILSPSIFEEIRKYKQENSTIKVVYTAHDYYFLYPNSSLLKYVGKKPSLVADFSIMKILFDRVDHRGWLYSYMKKVQWLVSHRLLNIKDSIDVILSPSLFLKNMLETHVNVPVSLVRNPMEFGRVETVQRHSDIDKLRLIYFGRLSPEKGILEFVHNLVGSHENYKLDIFGTGDLAEMLERFIDNNELSERVELKGFLEREDILKLLPSYHAMVLPSIWYENAPMSILEAVMNNLVVVVSNLGGMKEMAEMCTRHVLFDPFDVINFQCLLGDIRMAYSKPASCIDEIETFTYEHYLKQLLEVYRS